MSNDLNLAWPVKGIVLQVVTLLVFYTGQVSAENKTQAPGAYPAEVLLETGQDILGRPLEYPDCKPLIKSMMITLVPGQKGKMHQHLTPLYGYLMSGKIQVQYENEAKTIKTYSAGEAIMEAMHVDHYGFNPFDETAKLLVVYLECQKSE